LYTHKLMYDISNRGYHMFYTHRLLYDIFSNRGYDVFVYAQTDV